MLGMIVEARVLRKRNMTITTRATDNINSNWTSATEARIVVVLSVNTETWIDAGREDSNAGSIFLMPSTTWMTLKPGWR